MIDLDGRAAATDCDGTQKAFGSIQSAVDAPPPGSTILVCPGTYAEQAVVTTSNLTIRGLDEARTALRPSALPVDPGSPAAGTPSEGDCAGERRNRSDASFAHDRRQCRRRGATHFANCATVGFTLGIHYRNISGTVDSTNTTNIRSAARCSAAVFAESAWWRGQPRCEGQRTRQLRSRWHRVQRTEHRLHHNWKYAAGPRTGG
jgi:hypothetical protein